VSIVDLLRIGDVMSLGMRRAQLHMRKREFLDCHVTALSFPPDALRPLRNLYRDISAGTPPTRARMGRKSHEGYDGFEGVQMRWHYANSTEAIALFRAVLDACDLNWAREIVGSSPNLVRVVQACFIETLGSYPAGRWHADFTDEELGPGQSATMLTPLFTFQRNFGGLEVTAVERGMPLDFDDFSQVYRYRDGEAVLFDGSAMIHRTKRYRAKATARRVLACWQLADTSRRLRPALKRIGDRNGDPMFFHPHERMMEPSR
jgi:hypothetical protein